MEKVIKTARATVKVSPDGNTVEIRLNKVQRAMLEESAGLCREDFKPTMLDYFGISGEGLFNFSAICDAFYLFETKGYYAFRHHNEVSALVALIWEGRAKFVKQ